MKRMILLGCIFLLLLSGCSPRTEEREVSEKKRPTVVESPPLSADLGEIRAVWITQFELKPLFALSEDSFRDSFAEMMETCLDFGLNTVFVQVRPNGDAFYPSSYFPWSVYVSGTAGKGSGYDPLAIMLEEAHRVGIALHAWINPYRLQPVTQMEGLPDTYLTRRWYGLKDEDRIVTVNGVCYLNPGYEEARQLIADGVRELLEKYDLDGIHLDDYFYPTTDPSFDAAAYAKNGNGDPLDEFRRFNVDETLKIIYDTVKSYDPDLPFSVSPSGNLEGNYTKLYADVGKWLTQPGYLDWIVPQIYWNYEHDTRPFARTLQQWEQTVTAPKIRLIPGLACYKIANGEWSTIGDTLSRMVSDSRDQPHYGGVAFYSYASLFQAGEVMTAEKEAVQTLLQIYG